MPTTAKKPIEFSDLEYRITKICFVDGEEMEIKRRAEVVLGEPSIFYMEIPPGPAVRKARDSQVTDICYEVHHRPTHVVSPLFHHIFRGSPIFEGSGHLTFIGPMRLHPAEQVWPELTRLGYYGELPQFYT